jgi:hypothetical protein
MATTPSPSDNLWTEPESAATNDTPPDYGYNHATHTESGHLFELDDSIGRERVRLNHRSGTFIEMHPNGDEVHKVYGDGYEIIIKNKNVLIKGTCNITIEGDANMHVLGNKNERIDGDYNMEVRGDMIARVRGTNGMQLISDNDMTITSGQPGTGALYINASDHIYTASDLVVGGSISADTISAESRMNAGTGVYAGPLGVFSLGPVTAPTASIGYASIGIMDAVLMTDTINSTLFNSHTHIGNRGWPTSPPLAKFFGI